MKSFKKEKLIDDIHSHFVLYGDTLPEELSKQKLLTEPIRSLRRMRLALSILKEEVK